LGTAAYLSPEQARGDEAGPAADLYSLGVVAYQLLSGRLPYEANSLSELALKQQRESPIPLRRLNPTIPEPLADAVALSISVVAEERPRTARRLAELIADGAHGISPYSDDAPTRFIGSGEASTRVLSPRRDRDRTAATSVLGDGGSASASRTPRVVPARRPEPPTVDTPSRAAPGRDRGAARHRGRRVFAVLALITLVAVIAVVVLVLANQANQTVVHYQTVVASDVQSAISQVKQIIHNYVKK